MNNLLFLLVILTLCLSAYSQRKDVLFIAVDDFRTELGAYGQVEVKSPYMDALAAKSILFERAYCQIAVCSPSRASMLTGRRPDTNHVWLISPDEYWRTVTNATTIPQYFKENDYTSIGIGKIFHPGRPSGNDDVAYSWSLPYFHGKDKVSSGNSWYSFDNISDNTLRDGQIADQAVLTLEEIKNNRSQGDQKQFFLAVGFHKPHLPFEAPSKYFDMYPPADQIKPPTNPDAPLNMPPIAWSTSPELRSYPDMSKYNLDECREDAELAMRGDDCKITGTEATALRRAYYATVSYIDAQVGKVLEALESQGLANNTIIVLWGDHGFKLGEHNMWAKFTNMEDDTRVPLMLRVPGVTDAGIRTDALVELVDVFPTLAELAGLPVPQVCPKDNKEVLACVEGTSVVPLIKNPEKEWKNASFSQYPRRGGVGLKKIPGFPDFSLSDQESVMGYAIRTDKYRFVEWYTFDHSSATPDFSHVWGTELYNHTVEYQFFNDENTNVAGDPSMASIVKEMRQMLQAGWRGAVPNTESDI